MSISALYRLNARGWMQVLAVVLLLSGGAAMLSGCAVSGYTHLSERDQQDVRRVQDHFNKLTVVKAHFAQDASNGQQGDGVFCYVPGALRMDYEVPHSMVLVAHDGRLVLSDSSNGALTQISLKQRPLGFLLHKPLNFAGQGIEVVAVRRGMDSLQISLAQADNPSQGMLTLQFSDRRGKLSLVGIQGVDVRHQYFSLSLYDVQEGGPVPEKDAFAFPNGV